MRAVALSLSLTLSLLNLIHIMKPSHEENLCGADPVDKQKLMKETSFPQSTKDMSARRFYLIFSPRNKQNPAGTPTLVVSGYSTIGQSWTELQRISRSNSAAK